jgi:hypothetical protein
MDATRRHVVETQNDQMRLWRDVRMAAWKHSAALDWTETCEHVKSVRR